MPDQIAALRGRLAGRSLDLLFVNGAITRGDLPVGEVPTDMFVQVMVTNALSPMRVIEALKDLVPETGTIGVMFSRQGSISLNASGGQDLYRASKSALNQLMRSFAARHSDDPRTLLLISPGWVQTEPGGPGALLTIDQTCPASSTPSPPTRVNRACISSTTSTRSCPGRRRNARTRRRPPG